MGNKNYNDHWFTVLTLDIGAGRSAHYDEEDQRQNLAHDDQLGC